MAVREHLAERVAKLREQDRRVRAGEAGSVHKMRVATRRLRTAFKTYGPLLEGGKVDALGAELRWLGQELSGARDAQVLRERLQQLLATQPTDLVLGPVAVLIDDELRVAEQEGSANAVQTLEETRYVRLLEDLDALVQDPPFTTAADAPARKVFARLLRRDAKRVQAAVKQARHVEPGESLDVALHEVRKKAKRLRYAAESTVPVLGKRSARLASSVKRLQRALGEHHDTVMSRKLLREHGARSHVSGRNGFTFGRLHAIEEARAEALEREFASIWAGLKMSKVRKRLKD